MLKVKPVKIRYYICSSCIDKSKLFNRENIISLILFLSAGILFGIAGFLADSLGDSVSETVGNIVGFIGAIGAISLLIYSIVRYFKYFKKRFFWVNRNKKVLKLHAKSELMISKLEREI